MLRKHSILIGIIISMALLFIATLNYPGGSQVDHNSIGFNWTKNYFTNLFSATALNGSYSSSRLWAIPGMFFLTVASALFYIEFSKRIPAKGASKVVRYFGIGSMVCTFLVVTPLHDIMIKIGSTMSLVSIFYITVFVFKSKLHLFKVLCTLCLLASYFSLYIYYSGSLLPLLATMQKVTLLISVIWMLSLQYFTSAADFETASTVTVEKANRKTQDRVD